MKKFLVLPFLGALSLAVWQCANNPKPAAPTIQKAVVLQTHKEAADTLLADSTKPLKGIRYTALDAAAMRDLATKYRVDSLFLSDYPVNGFYGKDRYRIEFVFTEMTADKNDPLLYHVKGKNRYKKEISKFEGTIRLDKISSFKDPNLDTAEINAMDILNTYTVEGTFQLAEDPNLSSSGVFSGKMLLDFSTHKTSNRPELWFYSQSLKSGNCGYRFDGNWVSLKNKDMIKPVIWSQDLFRIGNDILKDFSYGEREVEINPKYRDLGWANFWENDEWWHDAKKPAM